MDNLKKQIIYLGTIEKVNSLLNSLVDKQNFHYEKIEEFPEFSLNTAQLINLILIDYKKWDFELHTILKKSKAFISI